MLPALLVAIFFLFVFCSALLGLVVTSLTIMQFYNPKRRVLGVCTLVAGVTSAIASTLIGMKFTNNVVGGLIIESNFGLGFVGWAVIGFAWGSTVFFVVASFARTLFTCSVLEAACNESRSTKCD